MIIIKNYDKILKDYLERKYTQRYIDKTYNDYLRFIEYCLRRTISDFTKYNDSIVRNVNKNKDINGFKSKIKKRCFIFNKRSDMLMRFKGCYTFNHKLLKNFKGVPKRKHLYNQIKNDLIDIGLLNKEENKQLILIRDNLDDINPFFTKEYWSLDLVDAIFDYKGDFQINKESKFKFDLQELLQLQHQVTPYKFIRNYLLLIDLNTNGYRITKRDKEGRIHNNISRISKEFRDIIKTKNGEDMISYDIKSSHPFWLSILTENENLYNDIVNDNLYNDLNKKTLLTWFNTDNYNSKKYKKCQERFFEYGIDYNKVRKSGKLYNKLAKLESKWIDSITSKLDFDTFTLYDQIYIPKSKENEFIKVLNNNQTKPFKIILEKCAQKESNIIN